MSSPNSEEAAVSRKRILFDDVYRPEARVIHFLVSLVLFGVAYGLYRGVQDNYLAELNHITPFERGIVEFFRELPGLLLIFILALMYRFTDSRIYKIGIAIMAGSAAGLLLTSASPFFMTKLSVVAFMVIYSIGDHIVMPVRITISMDLAKREKAGASLGITNALMQMGQIAGFVIITSLFFILARLGFSRTDILGYRIAYGMAVALMTSSALIALAIRETTIKSQRRRFYFARKFVKYYMLEVFMGARRQVFVTFAPYVLILHYKADPSLMSLLYTVCAVLGMIFSPMVGRLIDKLGYKPVMVTFSSLLIFVCIMYGYAHWLFPPAVATVLVCVNFILDSTISLTSMANNVYVQRIAANQEEITATLSTGMSVGHFISIFIALLGGWIWKTAGIEVLFAVSAFMGVLNTIYAASIKKSEEQRAG